jgi:glycosyltransferase involved in cell wall biosynthesis
MRITFLNSLYPPHGAAGAETTLRFLARRLADSGHTCNVVTLTPERRSTVGEVDGIPVHYLPLGNVYWPHGTRRPRALRPIFQLIDAYNPLMAARLRTKLRELQPQVVNCHNLQGFSVSAWTAAKSFGVPVVQTIHDYYLGCPRSAMWRPRRGNCVIPCMECRIFSLPRRVLSDIPAAVTCVSHRVFDRLTNAGTFSDPRTNKQPVRIIRGNNPHRVEVAAKSSDPSKLTLGFMGRIDPSKGLDILLDAVVRFPRQRLALLIAGKGDSSYLQSLRVAAAHHANVQFLGHVAPAAFFPRIDLLVVPSRWEDPFPRVFHEALAYGVPSLVTPQGGLPEVIRPGKNGFLAAGNDVAALHDAISRLLDPGWDRQAIQQACQQAASAYEPERIVSQYEAVLHAAATGGAVPLDAGEVWNNQHIADSDRTEVVPYGA